MTLVDEIPEHLKEAMKARDEFRISCLRMLKTSLKNKQVEKGRSLNDDEIRSVISSLIRKGQEAALEFKKGDRIDLAQKEEKEVQFFYTYLPEQMNPSQIESALKEIIAEMSAEGLKDLGKVMKVAMARLAEKAQGKAVSEIAKRLLSERSS